MRVSYENMIIQTGVSTTGVDITRAALWLKRKVTTPKHNDPLSLYPAVHADDERQL